MYVLSSASFTGLHLKWIVPCTGNCIETKPYLSEHASSEIAAGTMHAQDMSRDVLRKLLNTGLACSYSIRFNIVWNTKLHGEKCVLIP